jgi:alpha-glucosidase
MMPFLNEMRAQLDTFPERYAVGETYFASPQKTVSYCGPNRLHAAFSFDFTTHDLSYPWNPHWVIKQVLKREKNLNAAGVWPTTVLSNHDLPRAASRYSPGEDDTQAFLAMALLLTLRGTPFMYYGEEIGMRDIHLKRNEILDPPGKKYWPLYKGRDGCRAPMQWDDSAFAGFSSHKPWLPLHPDYQERNVSTQQIDPGSLFTFTKKLLALRKEIPALCRGEFEPLDSVPGMLAYMRRSEEQSVLVAMNFSGRQVTFSRPGGNWKTILTNSDGAPGMLAPHEIQLLLLE